jgi:hypothetical protein
MKSGANKVQMGNEDRSEEDEKDTKKLRPKKEKNVTKNRHREEPREYEMTDEEFDFEDQRISKVKKNCRRKECIVVIEEEARVRKSRNRDEAKRSRSNLKGLST